MTNMTWMRPFVGCLKPGLNGDPTREYSGNPAPVRAVGVTSVSNPRSRTERFLFHEYGRLEAFDLQSCGFVVLAQGDSWRTMSVLGCNALLAIMLGMKPLECTGNLKLEQAKLVLETLEREYPVVSHVAGIQLQELANGNDMQDVSIKCNSSRPAQALWESNCEAKANAQPQSTNAVGSSREIQIEPAVLIATQPACGNSPQHWECRLQRQPVASADMLPALKACRSSANRRPAIVLAFQPESKTRVETCGPHYERSANCRNAFSGASITPDAPISTLLPSSNCFGCLSFSHKTALSGNTGTSAVAAASMEQPPAMPATPQAAVASQAAAGAPEALELMADVNTLQIREGVVMSGLTAIITAIGVDGRDVLYQNAASVRYYGQRTSPSADLTVWGSALHSRTAGKGAGSCSLEANIVPQSIIAELFALDASKLDRMLTDVLVEGRVWMGLMPVPPSCNAEDTAFRTATDTAASTTIAAAAAAAAAAASAAVTDAPGGNSALVPSLLSPWVPSATIELPLDEASSLFLASLAENAPPAAVGKVPFSSTSRAVQRASGVMSQEACRSSTLIATLDGPTMCALELGASTVSSEGHGMDPLATSTWGLLMDPHGQELQQPKSQRQLQDEGSCVDSPTRCTAASSRLLSPSILASKGTEPSAPAPAWATGPAGSSGTQRQALGKQQAIAANSPDDVPRVIQGSLAQPQPPPLVRERLPLQEDHCPAPLVPSNKPPKASVIKLRRTSNRLLGGGVEACKQAGIQAGGFISYGAELAQLLESDEEPLKVPGRSASMIIPTLMSALQAPGRADGQGSAVAAFRPGPLRRCSSRVDLPGAARTASVSSSSVSRVVAFASSLPNAPSTLTGLRMPQSRNAGGAVYTGGTGVSMGSSVAEGWETFLASNASLLDSRRPRAEAACSLVAQRSGSNAVRCLSPPPGGSSSSVVAPASEVWRSGETVRASEAASGLSPTGTSSSWRGGRALRRAASAVEDNDASLRKGAQSQSDDIKTTGSPGELPASSTAGLRSRIRSLKLSRHFKLARSGEQEHKEACCSSKGGAGRSQARNEESAVVGPSGLDTIVSGSNTVGCNFEQDGVDAVSGAGGADSTIADASAVSVEVQAHSAMNGGHGITGRDETPGIAAVPSDGADTMTATAAAETQQPARARRCWHEVTVTRVTDPATGRPMIVLSQVDVSAKVEAERHLALVSEAEHRLLEQVFPRHVLATLTAEGAPWRPIDATRASRKSSRAAIRDVNRLATKHSQVTLLFADIQGFTPMCKQLEPQVVMAFLNNLFTSFDRRLDEFGVYKVETIGDCYFVAGGLIHEDEQGMPAVRARDSNADPLHAEKVLMFAKAMLAAASQVLLPTTGEPVRLRIGIHSGPVVSGVVGERMPRFCLFGDTVNTASRMESTGVAGCIHASEAAYQLLRNESWTPTGGIEVKGKGLMNTYLWAPPDRDSQAILAHYMSSAAATVTDDPAQLASRFSCRDMLRQFVATAFPDKNVGGSTDPGCTAGSGKDGHRASAAINQVPVEVVSVSMSGLARSLPPESYE